MKDITSNGCSHVESGFNVLLEGALIMAKKTLTVAQVVDFVSVNGGFATKSDIVAHFVGQGLDVKVNHVSGVCWDKKNGPVLSIGDYICLRSFEEAVQKMVDDAKALEQKSQAEKRSAEKEGRDAEKNQKKEEARLKREAERLAKLPREAKKPAAAAAPTPAEVPEPAAPEPEPEPEPAQEPEPEPASDPEVDPNRFVELDVVDGLAVYRHVTKDLFISRTEDNNLRAHFILKGGNKVVATDSGNSARESIGLLIETMTDVSRSMAEEGGEGEAIDEVEKVLAFLHKVKKQV